MSMANITQINVRLPPELLAAVDRACGDVPRNRWLVALLERTVGDDVVEATPSEAKETLASEQSGPVSVLSAQDKGVRPAASPSLHRSEGGALDAALSGQGPGDTRAVPSGSRSVKETAPTEHSALPRTHPDSDGLPLSRQQRLNAEKAKRAKPKKGKS